MTTPNLKNVYNAQTISKNEIKCQYQRKQHNSLSFLEAEESYLQQAAKVNYSPQLQKNVIIIDNKSISFTKTHFQILKNINGYLSHFLIV